MIGRVGQFQVIVSDFFLQLNLCVCYRENHFWPIVGLGRSLLTPARPPQFAGEQIYKGK